MVSDPAQQGPRPVPLIRGERVFLRPAERDDLSRFVRWLNDAEIAQYLAVRAPLSLPLEEKWFETMLGNQGKSDFHFVICLLADERPIGTIGLHGVSWEMGHTSVGIAIGERDAIGQGLGTDAMNAIVDFAFGELRLERIELDVYAFNPRARRSYEKVGFTHEGTLREAHLHHGDHVDVHRMSMLRGEWQALPRRRGWELEPHAATAGDPGNG
jgi:RimJ/RimL family protein N-acetyltransferase